MINLQRFFKKYQNPIIVLSAIFIVTGIALKWTLNGSQVFWSNLLLQLAAIITGVPIILRAVSALKARVISIELLVSIAVIGAFVIGEYNEAAIVTFLFLFGDFLEQKTLAKTRSSIRSLTEMSPTQATVVTAEGTEAVVEIDEIDVGTTVLIKPGEQVPIDGEIISGTGYLDQSAITGEARPVQRGLGEDVFSGSILTDGFLKIRTTKLAEDTTFAKILELVEEAQDTKSTAEKFIDKFAKYYTPAVLIIGLLVFLVSRDLKLAITVLVLGCPGALVIGAPVSNVAGIGNGAKHGVLVKGGAVMDEYAKVDTFVFDKTGTLTTGETKVTSMIEVGTPATMAGLRPLISYAESLSQHPLAKAVVTHLQAQSMPEIQPELGQNQVIKGQGLIVDFVNPARQLLIGNERLLQEHQITITPTVKAQINQIKQAGASIVLVAADGQLQVIFGISDVIKPTTKESLQQLRKLGAKRLIMLTGDNKVTADFVGQELGLDEVHAELLPEEKEQVIQDLQQQGATVAFVGDGINDSPSLARSEIGIAMGSGTDVAIETSDVVLMNSTMQQLVYSNVLAKKTVRNTRENIVIAIGVVLFLLLGLILGFIYMASGMFVHEISILVVILNAMRLLRLQPKKFKS